MFFNAVSPNFKEAPLILENGTECVYAKHVKLLGFDLDPSLTWKEHIDNTCKKMAKGVYALKQLKPITSPEHLKETYYSYIHSILSYGISIWGNATDFERVLIMQKRAIRVLVGGRYRESCRNHFKELKILTSVSQYILEIVKFVKRNPHLFKLKTYNSNRTKINRVLLEPTVPRLCMTKKLPTVMGEKLFNKLPAHIQSMNNDQQFCNSVKQLLLDQTLYSFKEYFENDYSQLEIVSNLA